MTTTLRPRAPHILACGPVFCALAMLLSCSAPAVVEDEIPQALAVDQAEPLVLSDEAALRDEAVLPDDSRLAARAGSCYADFICLYDTAQSASWMVAAPEYIQSYYCVVMSNHANKTSYIKNQTDAKWRVYDSNNCTGSYGPIYPRTAGGMNSTWNNKIGSMMREAIP